MALKKMDESQLKKLISKLQANKEMMIESHITVVEDTAKELFDIFTAPDKVADFSMKDDIKEIEGILRDRKNALESKESIKEKDMNIQYGELFTPTGVDIDPATKTSIMDSIRMETKLFYEDTLMDRFDPKLPIFSEFRDKLRKNPKFRITEMETIRKANSITIKNVNTALENDVLFRTGISAEMKEKLTRLIILFTQLDLFLETGTKKNQLDAANKILKNISLVTKQLNAYPTTKEALNIVTKRSKSLEGLETKNPKELPPETPDKGAKKSVSIDLKAHFLDTTKGLEEVPEGYEIAKLAWKNADAKDIELFEDDKGKKFEKTLKPGDPAAEIFIKNSEGKFIKLGKIEISSAKPTQLLIEIEAYKDLPTETKFPTKMEMEATGVGGKGKKLTDKVGITKTVTLERKKPDFNPEYSSLDAKYNIKKKLDEIFQEAYEAQLKDRLYEFMENNERTKGEWARMTTDEKNHFFQEIIIKNTNPTWLGTSIYSMIGDVSQANCYGNLEYNDDFRKWILDMFTGKTEQDLKKLIFEKLGTLDFTELNPTYAIKLLGDKVLDKYNAHKDGLYEALNAYLLNVRGGGLKVPTEKLRHGELAGVKEIKAAVADTKEMSREVAYRNAIKKIEDEYKSGMKFGYKRAKIFFFRERMLKNLINKELKGTGGLAMDDATKSAVNRRMTEKSMGGSFAENIVDVEKDKGEKIFDDPIFQTELDKAVIDYLTDTSADAETKLQTQVEDLIDSNGELNDYKKRNKLTHLGTNIIEQAKAEKAERTYYGSVIGTIDKYVKNGILNKPQEFEVEIRNSLEKFIKEQNKLPDMVKSLGLNMDKIDFATKLAQSRTTLETMRTRTIKMRLALFVNKSEELKGLTTAQYVNQDKFDVTHMRKFTRWMSKHPRRTTAITGVGLATTGVVGALTMPVLGVAGGAGILWYLNFLKKKGHYTQEHKKFEETLLAMTPDQRNKYLEELKEKSDKRPKRLRWAFPTKYSKYGESMEYFNNTDSVEHISKNIQKYLEKAGPFTPIEKQAFQRNLVDAISLVQAHKERGRNFMYGSEGEKNLEELYNGLYRLILAGITRYDPMAKDPEKIVAKILSKVSVGKKVSDTMDDQDRDARKMRQMRTKLGIFAGTRSAGIYLGSAYVVGWLKNQIIDGRNNVFGTPSHAAAAPTATPIMTTKTILDPAFGPNGDLLKNQIFNGDVTKFNAFVAKVQNIPGGSHSEKLRSIFKDMYGTDQLANQKTHDFFNMFAQNITNMPASAQQELVKLGTNFNLHSAKQISDLMTSRGYHGMVTDQSSINSLLASFKNGAIDLNHLPAGRTKETACNVLFCNTQGNQLTDLIFDKVSLVNPVPPIGPKPPLSPISGGHPRYDNFLSFGAPTVWNEVNKFDEEKK